METRYNEEYFSGQISKSEEKAEVQYGRLLHYAGIGASTHLRFLDAGCGAGPALGYLQRLGFSVTGSDLVLYPLLEARKRAPQARLVVANLEHGLPFASNSFNVVLVSEVVEHLHNPAKLLSDCYQALLPGGCLIVTTPNLWDMRRFLAKARGKVWIGYQDPTHINLMTPPQVVRLLQDAGFSKVKWRSGMKPMWSRSIRKLGWSLNIPYPPVIGGGIAAIAYKGNQQLG
ncbi:class I SAM-dependent methyltransferase [Candidatus Chlorohelix sp.]|uniref:class I SAM-dependent methyltransferase n=1 Tax=Candidatus Chlorohelix sp. TaxID=3139201 RepID=UPI00303D8DFF